jgi:hypothetical protein
MFKLASSERFKKEIENYERVISELVNTSVKKEAQELLRKLHQHVRAVDSGHDALRDGKALSETVHDSKSRIIEIRKRLDSIVRDWEKVKTV